MPFFRLLNMKFCSEVSIGRGTKDKEGEEDNCQTDVACFNNNALIFVTFFGGLTRVWHSQYAAHIN